MFRSPLLSIAALVASCAMLAACANSGSRAPGNAADHVAGPGAAVSAQADPENYEDRAREVLGTRSLPQAGLPDRALDSDLLYKFLLAEIAGQRGSYQVAAQAYLDMAKTTRDPRIARR